MIVTEQNVILGSFSTDVVLTCKMTCYHFCDPALSCENLSTRSPAEHEHLDTRPSPTSVHHVG